MPAGISVSSKQDHDGCSRTISNDRAALESSRPNTKERVLLLCVPTRVFTAAMPTSPMNDGCTTLTQLASDPLSLDFACNLFLHFAPTGSCTVRQVASAPTTQAWRAGRGAHACNAHGQAK